MNTQAYQSVPSNHNFGLEVDDMIKRKEEAKLTLMRSKLVLLDMGVKALVDGQLIHLPNLDVEAYKKCANQEFAWEAEYLDGSVLKQFGDGKQHHYGNIDQAQLKEIRWVSNFSDDTSNADKRVILTLDWKTGTFSLLNGFVMQDIRALFGEGQEGDKKLILKMVKRQSVSVDIQTQVQGEALFYNRYLLGWEVADTKRLLCIEPNGYVHLWHE